MSLIPRGSKFRWCDPGQILIIEKSARDRRVYGVVAAILRREQRPDAVRALGTLQNFAIAIPLKVSWFLSGRKSGRKRDVIFARSIYDIEAAVICGPWGHATPEAYYEANDGFADLGRLTCPLLCVQSSDDNVVPFSGKYAISDATLVNLSANIACCTTLLGGHLSFLDWRGRSWADRAVVEFFAAAAAAALANPSEEETRKRTKMRRSPSWREAARARRPKNGSSKAGGRDAGF